MPARVLEVDAAAVVRIDLSFVALRRIGPVREVACSDPAEDLVELVLADEEGVVLRGDLPLAAPL